MAIVFVLLLPGILSGLDFIESLDSEDSIHLGIGRQPVTKSRESPDQRPMPLTLAIYQPQRVSVRFTYFGDLSAATR